MGAKYHQHPLRHYSHQFTLHDDQATYVGSTNPRAIVIRNAIKF